jgi:hypothetical protein
MRRPEGIDIGDFKSRVAPPASADRDRSRHRNRFKTRLRLRPKDTTMWYSAVGCIVTLALSFLAAPLEADAQPSAKIPTIGYLSMAGGAPAGASFAEAFRLGLQDLGYVEGKTIAIAYRSAEGKPERLPALAAELVQLPVDVIFASTGQVAEAAKDGPIAYLSDTEYRSIP